MVRSRTLVGWFSVTADLKLVMNVSGERVPRRRTIPGDRRRETIRFTGSAMDRQLNGQNFRLIRHEPCQSSVLDPHGLLSVLFGRFLGAFGG